LDRSVGAENLVRFWKEFKFSPFEGSYVHPKDRTQIEKIEKFKRARSGKDSFERNCFRLSLCPVPYVGDIRQAKVFVLMTNPGYDGAEDIIENCLKMRDALERNLYQKFSNVEHPMWCLDSAYGAHPGANYWKTKLKSYLDFDNLSRDLCVIQHVPYHSIELRVGKRVYDLPSCVMVREFVRDSLLPLATQDEPEILLIAVRQVANWGLKNIPLSDNFVAYPDSLCLPAPLGPDSIGGQPLKNWLVQLQNRRDRN
jgi:hypothetical protein